MPDRRRPADHLVGGVADEARVGLELHRRRNMAGVIDGQAPTGMASNDDVAGWEALRLSSLERCCLRMAFRSSFLT